MPRNGSGVYGPPASTMATPNTPIESAKYNAYVADAAEAMTNSVNVNGTAPYKANQPMGGFKFTNQGAGSAPTDSVNLRQSQSSIAAHAIAVGGTTDTITATFSPAFEAWAENMRFRFLAGGANAVTAPTINVDGLGAKTIKKLNGIALSIGDIAGAGHVCECIYNGMDVILLNFAPLAENRANAFSAKQTFNGPFVKGTTILVDAPIIAWDLSTGADFRVTITSNRVLGAFTNGTPGQEGTFTVAQDTVGGWSLDLGNAVYDFWGPSIENIARGPNDETVYEYKVSSAGAMSLRRRGATTIGGSGRELLATFTANNNSTVDVIITKWLQLYDRFEIEFDDIQAAFDDVQFNLRTSANSGLSYDAGASNYGWAVMRLWPGGFDSKANGSDGQIVLVDNDGTHGLSNVFGDTVVGRVTIYNPRSPTQTKISWEVIHIPEVAGAIIVRAAGSGLRTNPGIVSAIRFFLSSGNIALGKFRLYGI